MSDVGAEYSEDGSAAAHELITTTTIRVLEKNYQDKLVIVQQEYEKRLRHMGDAIRETCSNLMTDDILAEMKTDHTSSAFIPAHLHEMIESQFGAEREAHIHGLVSKVSSLEMDAVKNSEIAEDLRRRLQKSQGHATRGKTAERVVHDLRSSLTNLEGQCELLATESKSELDDALRKNAELTQRVSDLSHQNEDMYHRLNLSAQELDILSTENESRAREIEMLERTNADASHGISMLQEAEDRERTVMDTMRSELGTTSRQKDKLAREVQELTARFKFARDELERTKASIEAREFDEGNNRKRMANLMQQVEAMLAQEASESNATVTVLHQKMKQLKHRYSTDMQREKRISASMQDELAAVKAAREDNMRELRLLTDDCSRLRDGLKAEQEKALTLSTKATICEEQETLAKSGMAEAHTRMQQAELRAEEVVRTRAEQIRLAEERARLEAERRMGSERMELDSRAQVYRLQYQSELGDLTNQLRHSFAFGDTMKSPHPTSGNHGNHHSGNHHESEHHHSGHHHSGHHHNENHHGHHDGDKEKVALKARLQEAAGHIERLKNMVVEMRAANAAKSTATLSVSSLDQEKYDREVNRLQGLLTEAREQLILHKSGCGGRDGATVSHLQTQLDEHKRMLKEVRDQSNRDHAVDAGIIDDMKSKFDRLMRMHDSTKADGAKEAQLKAQLDEKVELISELTEELKECHADLEDENNSAEMLAEYRRQVASYSERLDEEVSRRQELSRQLQEEKVAHRTTEESMTAGLLDMQKRAEHAEFAFSQLKMGKSSRSYSGDGAAHVHQL